MKVKRLILWICGVPIGLFLLLILLVLAASHSPLGAVLTHLPLGWWHFLGRNLPQMTCNWNLIATGVICSVLVVVVGHWLLKALFRQVQESMHTEQPARPWRYRWTISMYASAWLLFTIAFGAAGVFRHAAWLISYNQPWYEEKTGAFYELSLADMDVRELVQENDCDPVAVQKALFSGKNMMFNKDILFEKYDVIFFSNESNKVAAYLVVPRKPQLLAKGQFVMSPLAQGYARSFKPLSELQGAIEELDAKHSHKR